MKILVIVGCAILALGGGAFAFWKLRPATTVPTRATNQELKKGEKFPHELWTKVLKQHSKGGFVNYKALKEDHGELDDYLGYIAKFSPESHSELFPKREDKLAYAINAYNASVVKGVIDNYPVKSVRSIGVLPYHFFTGIDFQFGGKSYSLKAWETKTREEFKEPRVHFALDCASQGCPRLPEEAFEPDRLEEQLAREAKKFVAEERNVKVEGGKVKLSSIFKWYRDDFEGWQASTGKPKDLLAFIKEWGKDAQGEIEFVNYDWRLNDLK